MLDFAKEITNEINDSLKNNPLSKQSGLNLDNFHSINVNSFSAEELDLDNEISFIDGGQAILIDSPKICAARVKIGFITYKNNKRIFSQKDTYDIFVSQKNNSFIVKTFPKTDFDELILERDFIKNNNLQNNDLKKIVSIVRRCLELNLASIIKNPVIDGSFDYSCDLEKKYLFKLLTSSKNPIALSKSSNNVDEELLNVLSSNSLPQEILENSWYYCQNNTSHYINNASNTKNGFNLSQELFNKNNFSNHPVNIKILFVKLHENSKHIFRIDILEDISNKKDTESVYENLTTKYLSDNNIIKLLLLKNNSKDPIFLGYPYGLIDVDQYVRISDEEKDYLKLKLSSKLGSEYKKISRAENFLNTHQILDNIKF